MINNLTYEEAVEQLEKIIENLENEDTLEDTLKQYKKGIELYNYCSNILKKAEGEVKIILKDKKSLEDFDFLREDENGYYWRELYKSNR